MANKKTTGSFHGVGRRKAAVARVWLSRGTGEFIVNGRTCDEYFDTPTTRITVRQPFAITGRGSDMNVMVNVVGGGRVGQAGAVRLGITRALMESDQGLRPALKKSGFVTCDSRVKERKKYGQRGARRKFQFVKR